jgi:hypothetical protein
MPDEDPRILRQADQASPATASLRAKVAQVPKGETGRNAAKLHPKGETRHFRAEARTDFAAIESNLEFIMSQLAQVPSRKQLARYSLLVMVGTACLAQTLALRFQLNAGWTGEEAHI